MNAFFARFRIISALAFPELDREVVQYGHDHRYEARFPMPICYSDNEYTRANLNIIIINL